MIDTLINGRWTLKLPESRAQRPGWNWWERERLAAMYCAIRPGDLVLDVGAECGDMSALYASWGASVVLFEASPRMWPSIKATFEANELMPIDCFAGFVGQVDTAEWMSVDHPGEGLVMSTGVWPEQANGPLLDEPGFAHLDENDGTIPTITLDTYLAESGFRPPDVITMDIEGSELCALRGAERTLREHHPILFLSVHPEFLRERHGQTPDDLLVQLEMWGYDCTYLAYDHEQHFVCKAKTATSQLDPRRPAPMMGAQ